MNKASGNTLIITLLLVGFALVFQFGRNIGFETGSEWALVQADILAREAGVFMPVSLDEGKFRIVIKQPRGLYRRAWQLADKYDQTVRPLQTANVQQHNDEDAGRSGQAEF